MLSDKRGVENRGYESTVTGASCGEFEAWLCSERGRGCWVQVEQNNRGHFPNEYNKDRVSLTGPPQVRHPLCRFLKNITDGGRKRIKETADRKVFWGRREVTEETDWRRCEQTAAYTFVYRRRVMRQQKQRDRKKKSSLTSRLIYIYIFSISWMFFLFPTYKRKTYHRSLSPFIRLITSFNATASEKNNRTKSSRERNVDFSFEPHKYFKG